MFSSIVPPSCIASPGEPPIDVRIGIDETGRGAMLGPMIYCAAYWAESDDEAISKLGYDDSKALSAAKREKYALGIEADARIGFACRLVSSKEISQKMTRRCPVSLNVIAFDATVDAVQAIRDAGVHVARAFVDTVGDPDRWRMRLSAVFNGQIDFVVEKKADATYPVVSAASIVAKYLRDATVESCLFEEPHLNASGPHVLGSGYPGDPKMKSWAAGHVDRIFGFPSNMRFAWKNIRLVLEDDAQCATVDWGDEEEEEEVDTAQTSLMGWFGATAKAAKRPRCEYFARRGLENVAELD